MASARIILAFAWFVGLLGIVVSSTVWGRPFVHRVRIGILAAALIGGALLLLDKWTVLHRPTEVHPIDSADFRRALVDEIANAVFARISSLINRHIDVASAPVPKPAIAAKQGGTLFEDNFTAFGTRPDVRWTTEVGCSSFVGRTQLRDWVTPTLGSQFVVGPGGAQLALNTFNPSGSSLFGTHGKTKTSFRPDANTTIIFNTKLQLTSLQKALVYGMYFYAIPDPCVDFAHSQHDEIDIELVTNMLHPGGPLRVQLNHYASELLGQGNGVVANLPYGFHPLAPHDWTIRWTLGSVEYLVDGVHLYRTTTHVPQGPMHVNEIAWAPSLDWMTAYDDSLQPASSAHNDQSFVALIRSVTVRSERQ